MQLDDSSPLAAAHRISDTTNPLIDVTQNDEVKCVCPTKSPADPMPPAVPLYSAPYFNRSPLSAVTNSYSRTSAHTGDSVALRGDFESKSASLQSQLDWENGDDRYDNNDDRRAGNKHNEHSPPDRRRRSASYQQEGPLSTYVEWDFSIGNGNIKILSRTLFVSGTVSEAHLRSIFENFGSVQTCIVNSDKRHAFVKMLSRQGAVKARTEAGWYDSDGIQFRTRWGNGFGPRYCNDYRTGVSVIPLRNLTRGDRKWLLTAKHGGTGSLPLKSGMVVEEPDIEIGAGVSSKSLSWIRAATRSKYGQGSQWIRHRGRSHTERPDRVYAGRTGQTPPWRHPHTERPDQTCR